MTLLPGPGALCHFADVNGKVASSPVDVPLMSLSPEEPSVLIASWLLDHSETRDHHQRITRSPNSQRPAATTPRGIYWAKMYSLLLSLVFIAE